MADQSNKGILTRLDERLRLARQLYDEGEDGGRAGAQAAINAAAEFIMSIEEMHRDELAVPLVAAAAALDDLERGIRHEMLKPAEKVRQSITIDGKTRWYGIRAFQATLHELALNFKPAIQFFLGRRTSMASQHGLEPSENLDDIVFLGGTKSINDLQVPL